MLGLPPQLYGPFVPGQPLTAIMFSASGESLLKYIFSGGAILSSEGLELSEIPDAEFEVQIGTRGMGPVRVDGADSPYCNVGF